MSSLEALISELEDLEWKCQAAALSANIAVGTASEMGDLTTLDPYPPYEMVVLVTVNIADALAETGNALEFARTALNESRGHS